MIDFKELKEEALAHYSHTLRLFLKNNKIADDKQLAKIIGKSVSSISRLGQKKYNGKFPRITTTIAHLDKIHKAIEVSCIEKDGKTYKFEANEFEKTSKNLQRLATKLACNLVDVSTSFGEKDKPYKRIINEDVLKRFQVSSKRERFILITGAGVSHSATKEDMPLADKGIDVIKKEVVDKDKVPQSLIDTELELLKISTGLDVKEFETKLLAYSKFSPEGVKRGLRKMCEIKHLPNMEYEILAHMIKHRFIDIALNFNFDEIFDTNLQEEITTKNFQYIFSDGHCPYNNEKELLIHNRLKRPVYIKPHGTISHTSSLRFTKEKFVQLPIQIKKTIQYLIKGELPSGLGQKKLKVNFIVVGFGMKSPILLETIKNYLNNLKSPKEAPCFWFFDTKTSLAEFNLELTQEQKDLINKNSYFFKIDEKNSLPDYLEKLWELVEGCFNDNFKPRGIERHRLINEIFNFSKSDVRKMRRGNDKEFLENYLKDRILVELIIRFLASDGIINLTQIMESRIGNYIHELNTIRGKGNQYYLKDFCKLIGLKIYKGFLTDAYTLEDPNFFYEEALYKDLYQKMIQNLTLQKRKEALSAEDFIFYAKKIRDRNALKLNPDFSQPHSNLFSSVKDENILNTGLSWLFEYRKFLEKKDDWDLILAISEKGRFIPVKDRVLKQHYLDEGKKLELVLSAFDLDNFDNISPKDDRFKNLKLLSNNKPLFLPWWLHNRHMVIFLKQKPESRIRKVKTERGKWDIKEAFYYQSRMLSRKVNPIRVTEKDDLDILLNIYANYWHRARIYTEQLKEKSEGKKLKNVNIPIIQDKEELSGYIEDLLSLYKLSD